MGLTAAADALRGRLAHWAALRPHVLLVVCPGATAVRLACETAVTRLNGRLAHSPADADVLLVAGDPAGPMRAAADELWAQLPGPRARAVVTDVERAEESLRQALTTLTGPGQRADAHARDDEWTPPDEPSDGHEGHGGHGGHGEHGEHGGDDEGHEDDTEDGEHGEHGGGHEGHGGHGGHGGEMPGGLGMAERGADRDGLKLDVLHVPLGPVLPHWPAGLVVDTRLQGDVVQWADARVLPVRGRPGTPYWHAGDPAARPRRVAAAHLDSLARLLALAGWAAAERAALELRDRLTGSAEPADAVRADFAALRRRLERSRMLRWATDGLGVLTPGHAERLGVGGPAVRAGEPWDATARWRRWLLETERLLGGGEPFDGGPRGPGDRDRPASRALLDAAVASLPGLDLTAARLLVASFDPDPDELAPAEPPGAGAASGHGDQQHGRDHEEHQERQERQEHRRHGDHRHGEERS